MEWDPLYILYSVYTCRTYILGNRKRARSNPILRATILCAGVWRRPVEERNPLHQEQPLQFHILCVWMRRGEFSNFKSYGTRWRAAFERQNRVIRSYSHTYIHIYYRQTTVESLDNNSVEQMFQGRLWMGHGDVNKLQTGLESTHANRLRFQRKPGIRAFDGVWVGGLEGVQWLTLSWLYIRVHLKSMTAFRRSHQSRQNSNLMPIQVIFHVCMRVCLEHLPASRSIISIVN